MTVTLFNPYAPTRITRDGTKLEPGENRMADAAVLAGPWLLLIQRGDGAGWAIPGGRIDDGETAEQAAWRELAEETGLAVDEADRRRAAVWPERYVPDPRNSYEAWAVTTVVTVDLGPRDELPAVTGSTDARRAGWFRADSYAALVDAVAGAGGRIFQAHEQILRDLLHW